MNFILRKAVEDDAADICLIQQVTWRSTYISKEESVTQEDLNEYTESWTSDKNISLFKDLIAHQSDWLVVEIRKKVVGHLLVEKKNGYKIIQMFYILPEYQNYGFGKAMLDMVCAESDIDIFVDVVDYNKKAINFYERNGFKFYRNEPNLAKPLPSGKTLRLKRYKKPAR